MRVLLGAQLSKSAMACGAERSVPACAQCMDWYPGLHARRALSTWRPQAELQPAQLPTPASVPSEQLNQPLLALSQSGRADTGFTSATGRLWPGRAPARAWHADFVLANMFVQVSG